MSHGTRHQRGEEAALPSVWSERHTKIHRAPWGFTGREYLRDIMDDAAPRVVVKKAAQLGVTEILQRMGAHAVAFSHNAMMVFPTEDTARRHSKARFNAMLEASAYLRSIFQEVDAVDVKRSLDASLYFEGSNSGDALFSVPLWLLLIDELDRCNQNAVTTAMWRLSGTPGSRAVLVSTPTLPSFGIDAEFQDSDQKHWMLECPAGCGNVSPLEMESPDLEAWDRIRWDGYPTVPPRDDVEAISKTAQIVCSRCGHAWTETDRLQVSAGGRWEASFPGRDVSGYALAQWISPTRTVAAICADYFRAWHSVNPEAMRQWVNQAAGLPFGGEGNSVAREEMEACSVREIEDAGHHYRCAGVDVGKKLHVAIGGKTREDQLVCTETLMLDGFEALRDLIRTRRIVSLVIDAYPETRMTEQLCEDFPSVVYRAGFPESRKDLYRWDTDRQWLDIRRIDAVDQLHNRVRKGKLAVARVGLWQMLVEHMTRIHVQVELDRHGNQQRVVKGKVGGADDMGFALLFLDAAASRVRYSSSEIPAERLWTPDTKAGLNPHMSDLRADPLLAEAATWSIEGLYDPEVDYGI